MRFFPKFVNYPWMSRCPSCRAHHLPVANGRNHFHPFFLITLISGLLVAEFFLCPHFLIPHSYSQTPQMYSAGRAGMNFIQSSLSAVPSFFDLLQGEDRQRHQTSVTRSSAHALSFHVIFHPKLQISSGFLTLQSKYHQQSITVKHPEPEQNHPAAGSSTVVVGGM